MTTKSTLKAADWDLLKESPQLIETMMTEHRSGHGGLVGKRYQHILDKVITEYKTNNALVNDVQEFNKNPTLNSAITFDQAQKKMEQIGTLLESNVDSPDADAVREFLLTISQHFAEETSEGLFGMGSDVSKKEHEVLDMMRVALKATDTDAQRREREAQQEKAAAKAQAEAKAAEEAAKKREAEAKAKAEAEAKARAEAKAAEEAAKKREAEAKAKAEAEAAEEARKKQEAEAKAKAKAEEEAARKREAEAKAKAAAAEAARKKREAEEKAKAEAEQKAKEAPAAPKAEPAVAKQKPVTASPTPQPAAAQQKAETAERIYEVKPGDSLSKIALEVYGNAARWSEIFEANKDQIKNPNLIHPGQKFRIP